MADGRRAVIVINHDKHDREVAISFGEKRVEAFRALGNVTEWKDGTLRIEHNNAAYFILS